MRELPPADLIPPEGLCEVLRGWSGRGLLSTVAALSLGNRIFDREWRAADVFSRARRALLSSLAEEHGGSAGPIARLPCSVHAWLDVIPAAALRHRRVDTAPFRGVDWVATRRLHGWPPIAFAGRVRHRVSDDTLLAPTVWVLDQLVALADQQSALPPNVLKNIVPQIRAAAELLQHETVRQLMPAERPNSEGTAILSNEGTPWSVVAEISRVMSAVDDDPFAMATKVLFPDESIAWRLFHLACFGEVLLALSQQGYHVVSQRPLASEGGGPTYRAIQGVTKFDVWFEAAGAWTHYGIASPYRTAVPSDGKPLGADILVRAESGEKALLIECKYYLSKPEQMPRDGYLQALAYAAEAHGRLAMQVRAVAVGPERLLPWQGHTNTSVGDIHVCSHAHLRTLVAAFLSS